MNSRIHGDSLGSPILLLALGILLPCIRSAGEPGLVATYRSLREPALADVMAVDHPALFVPASASPTPFLPPGRFEVAWRGSIRVDLRSECAFRADLRGRLVLRINDRVVLEAVGEGESLPLSEPVRLNKGANAIEVWFESPESGDAMLRLWWSDFEKGLQPLGKSALEWTDRSAVLEAADERRLGRELFIDLRCARCHESPPAELAPDAALPASSLEGIGSRRRADWMARWIVDPRSVRPSARMPRLLHGADARGDARAMADYLDSLREPAEAPGSAIPEELDSEAGKALFEKLHCGACHDEPGVGEPNGSKLSLSGVSEKFTFESLIAFLLEPEARHRWTRMPNFGLGAVEARQLAVFLGAAEAVIDAPVPETVEGSRARGGRLVRTLGCLKCHDLTMGNEFVAKPMGELDAERGCLAEPGTTAGVPDFSLTEERRRALRAFLRTDRLSLQRDAPAEFARRHVRQLHCTGCHGEFDGFPSLDGLGGKLKPEWMARFLSGKVRAKPRPWLEARMPRFPSWAGRLSRGLAMLNGFAPVTREEGEIDEEKAAVGRRLVGKRDGFSCVACHAVASQRATDVFDSEGINLAYSAERLQYLFFRRWLLDPLTIDSQTKMPDFFDGKESPLTEVYDGDAGRQVDSVWQYLRLGSRMLPPERE